MDSRVVLDDATLASFRHKFASDPKNILAQNVCTRIDPFEACFSRSTIQNTQHVFTLKVEAEGKPVTNQKSSGRCWIFACLNVIRIPFCKQCSIDGDFEFSQSYLFFWDKLERCNYFLQNIVATARRGEAVEGRLVSFLLSDPLSDGGQWDMLRNLIVKHGLVPKKLFPESFTSEATAKMNLILKSKLREYSKALRKLVDQEAKDEEINRTILEQMSTLYRVVGICLGIPPDTFTWQYYDKNKAYHEVGPITPLDFYEKHVKPVFDVERMVCLVTDPRPTNDYGKLYTIDCLGNVVGGRSVAYNNQPVQVLLQATRDSIAAGQAVWFGCDVNKRFGGKLGIEDLNLHNFPLVFGTDVCLQMNKAERLIYGESAMTHAMVFTAVGLDGKGEVAKLRVENSWGDEQGEKGYIAMSADWFREFVYEVVVDREFVSDEILQVFDQKPIVLPAWDPMGTLAR